MPLNSFILQGAAVFTLPCTHHYQRGKFTNFRLSPIEVGKLFPRMYLFWKGEHIALPR